MKFPAEWTCNPAHCEYLGCDPETGVQYWRIRWEVVTYLSGATRWLCTTAAWPTFCLIHAVKVA